MGKCPNRTNRKLFIICQQIDNSDVFEQEECSSRSAIATPFDYVNKVKLNLVDVLHSNKYFNPKHFSKENVRNVNHQSLMLARTTLKASTLVLDIKSALYLMLSLTTKPFLLQRMTHHGYVEI